MKTVIEMACEAKLVCAVDDPTAFWPEVHDMTPELKAFEALVRNATLDEIATKIDQMPFGDTAASFAVWIREQKQ